MEVRRFEHAKFTSNTYVFFEKAEHAAFVVDIGEYEQSKQFLDTFSRVPALFLTHAHYDHIYHINSFLEDHPECLVYASPYALKALATPKLNLSFYHQDPIAYQGTAARSLQEGDCIAISESLSVRIFATPGHTPGCLSYQVGTYLFTGDAYIPGYKVVTKLKGGDKQLGAQSFARIKKQLTKESILCPGHGMTYRGHELHLAVREK